MMAHAQNDLSQHDNVDSIDDNESRRTMMAQNDLSQHDNVDSIDDNESRRTRMAQNDLSQHDNVDSIDDNESIGFPLFLSEEEVEMLPWQQMLNNGAVNPKAVVVLSHEEDNESDADDEGSEEDFSDGEISGDNQTLHNNIELELRNYQKELAANALLGENTIICAPTGSGKTRVATYIISNHLMNSDQREKKVAFLARTVPLAEQQYKALCKYLPNYEVTLITGDKQNNMSLHLLLPHFHIVVMTPMILENHLTRNLLSDLGVFSLIVFDECHHTRKGEPYNTLMSSYHKTKHQIRQARLQGKLLNISLPQIVGLTASIGIEKAQSVTAARDSILRICGNLDVSTISTVEEHKKELETIVPVATELTKELSHRRDDVAVQRIIEIMHRLERQMGVYIRRLNNAELNGVASLVPGNKKLPEYEQWAIKMMTTAKCVPLSDAERDMLVRLTVKITQYLLGFHFALETYDLVELKDVMEYLERCFQDLQAHAKRTDEENAFYDNFSELKEFVLHEHVDRNPNLQILADTLIEHLINKGNTTRCIIFVKTRALAEALSSWLNRCEVQELKNLNACAFTGSNASVLQGGTSQARQESIIQQFRSGIVRVIVATSVAEEGIDIPECNLVIKYNHVGNEVTTVQTRGRSRAFNGVSVLLAVDSVREREFGNRARVSLMEEAIGSIKSMGRNEFSAAVNEYQQELLTLALIAEEAEKVKKQQFRNVPFKIVCPLCRKVSIDKTNMRTIYGKYRISVDRNLLNQIMLRPYFQREPLDGLDFVGQVLCKGEIRPGKLCYHQLGVMIKFKGVPMVAVGIDKIVFQVGTDPDLKKHKKWKKVNLHIEELNYNDFKRYITESNILGMVQDSSVNNEAEDDSSGHLTNNI